MSASPAFQFYPQDFLVGTADMSAQEVGAYIRLLCYQWSKEGLPNDEAKLAAMGGIHGTSMEWVWEKFVLCPDGKLRNARLETVRNASNKFRARQAANSRKRNRGSSMDDPREIHGIKAEETRHVPDACSSSSSSEEDTKGKLTLENVLEYAKSPQGNIDLAVAEIWWNEQDSRPRHASGALMDAKGGPIADWKRALRAYGLKWQNNRLQFQPRGKTANGASNRPPSIRDCDIPGKFEGVDALEILRKKAAGEDAE